MDRRNFLRTTVTGLGLAACPGWIARAFGGETTEASRINDLSEARTRAVKAGKPLLVLVIPAGDAKRDRGEIFGGLINHGGAQAREDLLSCEIVCATMADVRKVLPGEAVKDEPLMLLVETHEGAGRPVRIDPEVPEEIPWDWDKREECDKAIRARIDKVADALHRALLPDGDSLAVRARRNREALPAEDRKALDAILNGQREADPDLVQRGAVALRYAGANAPEKDARERVGKALADTAEAKVVKSKPAGAKWAKSCGCGVEVEGEMDGLGIACGMGYVPELSQRFLWFYTKS